MRKLQPFLIIAILSFCLLVFIPFVQAQSDYQSEYPILSIGGKKIVIRRGNYPNVPHPFMSNNFSKNQQFFLLQSFGMLDKIFGNERDQLTACLSKYAKKEVTASFSKYSDISSKSFWDNWNFTQITNITRGGLGRIRVNLNGITKAPIFIDKFYEESNVLAHAEVGIDWLTNGFRIGINEYSLNRSMADPQKFGDYTMWTGAILHEIMHNFGFDHEVLSKNPSHEEFISKVVGNLNYEAGWCVARFNKDKAYNSYSLTENELPGFYVD